MPGRQDIGDTVTLSAPDDAGIDFGSLFQVAPVGFAVLDADLRYIRCNDALAEINGRPAQEHLGRTLSEMVPQLAPQLEARFRSVFVTGLPHEGLKVRGVTAKAPGQLRTWLECIRPITAPDGTVGHILVSVQEITA